MRPRSPSMSARPDTLRSRTRSGRPSSRRCTASASSAATTASAASRSPPASSTPVARPPATAIRSTRAPSRSVPPTAASRAGERLHQRVEAAARVPGAPGVLDVARDGERRRRAAGIRPGVRGEALDDHPQPGVRRVGVRELAQRAPGLDADEIERRRPGVAGPRAPRRPRRRPAQHALRGAPHPLARPHERRPLVARARPPRVERGAGAAEVGGEVEARAVGEAVAGDGLDGQQLELGGERRARLREQRLEDPRHRQQRRPGVPREAPALDAAALAARRVARLEHGDRVAGRGEPDGGREPADARADDDDLHRRRHRRRSAGAAIAPMASAPATATRGRRQSTALANVSPSQVQA